MDRLPSSENLGIYQFFLDLDEIMEFLENTLRRIVAFSLILFMIGRTIWTLINE
jgi:hypothetical protein